MRQPSCAIRVDDDVGLHVLRCRVDILGTNCHSKQDLSGGTCRCFMHREDVQKCWCPEMLLLQLLVSPQHSLFNTDSSLKVAVYSGSQKDHKVKFTVITHMCTNMFWSWFLNIGTCINCFWQWEGMKDLCYCMCPHLQQPHPR